MPDITISVTDEAYAMLEAHLQTILKLSDDGKQWEPAGITVDEWAEGVFRNACAPIISTSSMATIAAARQAMEEAQRTAVDGLLFAKGAAGVRKAG